MMMKAFALCLGILSLLALAGIPNAITTSPCADGTQYGQCSAHSPGMYCTGSLSSPTLGFLLTACPCSNYPGYTQHGSGDAATCVATKCSDGSSSGQCSTTKPKQCVNGGFIDNATACGCSTGQIKSPDGLSCTYPPCTDGGVSVQNGQCSTNPSTRYKKCVNGALVNKSSECGCPSGMNVTGDTCTNFCIDGTADGSCSVTKPKKCVNGYLLERASECGCQSDKTAVGNNCADSVLGNGGGADLLTGAGNSSGAGANASGAPNALSCCCLPTALRGVVGGFAVFRKRK